MSYSKQIDRSNFVDARPLLRYVSFFMGDLRDGLPLLNMQSTYLVISKGYTEKQVGVLFFVFGIAQFLCMGPIGYFLDDSNRKIEWVYSSCIVTSLVTVFVAAFAQDEGANIWFLIICRLIQGASTSVFTPGFAGITLGIVGSTGFTYQVSRNKMMGHIGTALTVSIASLTAYFLYPDIGLLFIISPIFAIFLVHFMLKIKPKDVDTDAARALIIESPTMTEYEEVDDENEVAEIMSMAENDQDIMFHESQNDDNYDYDDIDFDKYLPKYVPPELSPRSLDSHQNNNNDTSKTPGPFPGNLFEKNIFELSLKYLKERTPSWSDLKKLQAAPPVAVMTEKNFALFVVINFLFHLSNTSVLPLVMQSLALESQQLGILMSGSCIIFGQTFMTAFAKLAGDYSIVYGRKPFYVAALFSLTVRCLLLVFLLKLREPYVDGKGPHLMDALIMSTQFFDAVGAGLTGTLYYIVTNDLSEGTGRFSLMMGIISGSMCLGATFSGYIGQAIAEDYGYSEALMVLAAISLLPTLLYVFVMPETLPEYAKRKPTPKNRRKKIISLLVEINRRRRLAFAKNAEKLKATFTPKKGQSKQETGEWYSQLPDGNESSNRTNNNESTLQTDVPRLQDHTLV
eukprot:CAMPEP_0178941128 /NCGR_PEP_ID=MMETSP0789-20121207/1216_1 /TAXON_ID=3005 /ORGANISM="Rhizosolenia setigera, Strain CCMP 1694" /LENGTH=625 /DNA_ID=CAMNT_0020620291 /DNA_START=290 /DNA_END=2167 /DNA_ORIENTATION=-